MWKNDGPNATPAGEFSDGQPFLQVQSSLVIAKWLNTMQRELVNLVEGAGITLGENDFEQVKQAVIALAVIHGGGGGGGETIVGGNVGTGIGVYKDKVTGTPSTLRFRSIAPEAGGAISVALNGDDVEVAVAQAGASALGVIQLAGQLGGTAAAPDVRGLRATDAGGTLLTLGAVPDGTFLKRVGSTIEGATAGAGGGDVQGPGATPGLAGTIPAWTNDTGTLLDATDLALDDVQRFSAPPDWTRTDVQIATSPATRSLVVVGAGHLPEMVATDTALVEDGTGRGLELIPEAVLYNEASSPPAGEGSGGSAGIRFSTWDVVRAGWDSGFRFDFDTPASLANLRLWAGLWSRDPAPRSAAAASEYCVAAQFDTGLGHGTSGKWRLVTSSGGGTSNVVEASAGTSEDTVPAGTRVRLDIRPVFTGSVVTAWELYVDGVLLATSSTNLPAATVQLAPTLRSVNLITAVQRSLVFRRLSYWNP